MEFSKIIIVTLVISAIVVASIIALPYLTERLTRPVWAVQKTAIEFLALWLLCSLLIPSVLAVGVAFVVAAFRYQSRLKRYASLLAAEAERTAGD